MFAFDTLNNEVKINLNPIYQAINGLSEDKLDKTEYDVLFDGLFLDSQKKLSNYLDRSREAYFMDAYEWTKQTNEPTPLNSGYYVAKSEQNAVLNYNNNVNYVEDLNNIVNAALNEDNVYKDRIELTGNLNFSDLITLTDTDIKTIVLKNKNINNDIGISYENGKNVWFNIDGFKSITNLELNNTPGEIKIKNCDEIINNLRANNLKEVIFDNIGQISGNTIPAGGWFHNIDNLKLKNISINNDNNFNFQTIKNLIIEDATISGRRANMFSKISNAKFNNVEFYLSPVITKSAEFNNNNGITKYFNNFDFNNCSFNGTAGAYFNGINGKLNDCLFNKLHFHIMNDLTFNVDNIDNNALLTFNIHSSYNTININNHKRYHYLFSVENGDNFINFENKLNVAYDFTCGIMIDEGNNTTSSFKNNYSFMNDKYFSMLINYGNINATGSTQKKHPKIYLDINNVLKFNSPNGELKNNTFDIYFNDSFNENNFIVSDFKKFIESSPELAWQVGAINVFNLHFNQDTVFNTAFYNKFLSMFGGSKSTNTSFKNYLTKILKIYDVAGYQITNFV